MTNEVDLRNETHRVRDQGRRGTCVACASTVAHQMIRGDEIEFSVEFLHWAAKRRDDLPETSEGTTLVAAKEALENDGQPPEDLWPYNESRNQWATGYRPSPSAISEAKHRILAGGQMINPGSVDARGELEAGHPVVLGIRLFSTWYSVGPDGLITTPIATAHDLGGHAVLLVGYRADDFIVQNSWGDDWGNGGFAYLAADQIDRFGIAAWSLSL